MVPLILFALVLGAGRTWYVFQTAKDLFDRNLTAVSVAAQPLYDMEKALEKSIQIESIHLVSKSGGKSDYLE